MASSQPLRLSPWETIDRVMNEREMLVQSLYQITEALPQLSSVKSCAMIGCGYGHLDLEFVSRCLPNVQKLTAVEPDADQMAAFKTRVAQLLPHVSTEFCQQTAQSWKGADRPFDAVLLFHCLYCIPLPERPALAKKLFDHVVASDGLVFTLISPCDPQKPTGFSKLYDVCGLWPSDLVGASDGVQVRDMMTSAGFIDCYQLPIEWQVDAEELNDDLMSVVVFWSGGKLTLEKVREAVKEVLGGEKCLKNDMCFGVFQKP